MCLCVRSNVSLFLFRSGLANSKKNLMKKPVIFDG